MRAEPRRTRQLLTLPVVDIDEFKWVNDTHGHQAGDDVLRATAAALASSTKGYDLVVRLGGDELAVILPGCPVPAAPRVAERLRAAVAAETAPSRPATVSIGWAVAPAHALEAMDLLAAAGDGLYAAKRAGRDCSRGAPQADQTESEAASARKRR